MAERHHPAALNSVEGSTERGRDLVDPSASPSEHEGVQAVVSLRQTFAVTRQFGYLNHAGLGPLSKMAADRAAEVLVLQATKGSLGSSTWQAWLASARRRASALIGAGEHEIAFLKNTPEGISTIASGLDWRAGDNVVIPACEFPANVYPWMNLQPLGVEVRFVTAPAGAVTPAGLAQAIDDRTRMIAVSWIQFLSGARIDLAEVGDLCERRGILFLVDAIQGLGVYPIDVRQAGIHFLATASHKWLLAPMGAGWLYCRADLLDTLRLFEVGQSTVRPSESYLEYRYEPKPDARRFEAGVPAYASIAGLDGALESLNRVGLTTVQTRVEALCTYLIERLKLFGCEVLTPLDPLQRAGIVTFRHPVNSSSDLVEQLSAAGIVVVNREGWIRVSPHYYNTTEEIDRLLSVLHR